MVCVHDASWQFARDSEGLQCSLTSRKAWSSLQRGPVELLSAGGGWRTVVGLDCAGCLLREAWEGVLWTWGADGVHGCAADRGGRRRLRPTPVRYGCRQQGGFLPPPIPPIPPIPSTDTPAPAIRVFVRCTVWPRTLVGWNHVTDLLRSGSSLSDCAGCRQWSIAGVKEAVSVRHE